MRRTQRGGVLILTLGILTALVLILTAAVSTQRQASRAERNRMDGRLAEISARAAVQRAIAALATQAASPTKLQDEWATLGTNGNENFILASGRFRMQIVDAGSLINLNTAPLAQLQRLPLTQEQIDCLLDFREASRTARADGAKDEYYNNLQNPYNTKLLPFESVDELLQVKDFTPSVLYEPQTAVVSTANPLVAEADGVTPVLADLLTVDSSSSATSAAGAALPTLAQARNAQQLVNAGVPAQLANTIYGQRQTFRTMGNVMAVQGMTPAAARAIVNAFRVGGTATQAGKINLNTATDNVLNSLPNLAPDIVSAIISRQSSGFTQLGDVFDIPGYTVAVARQTIDQFAINSSVFEIRVVGTAGPQYDSSNSSNDAVTPADTWAGSAKVALIAIVKIQNGRPPQILRIERPPQPDVEISRWGWDAATSTDTDLRVSQ